MIKRIISLVLVALFMNAGIRIGLVFFHDQQFKDAIRELALFSGTKTEEVVRSQVMQIAQDNQIPLDADFVEIHRTSIPGMGDHSAIKVSYAVMVQVAPGYARRFEFDYATQ